METNENLLITVNEKNCVGCNACIRTCPAPEANITRQREDGSFYTIVDNDRCINCGECIRSCKHDARGYNDDTERFFSDLKNQNKKINVLVAPSIKTSFPDNWQGVLNWLRQYANVSGIYDVSFGADICTWAHLRMITAKRVGNIISQPCASIVNYAKKYNTDLIKHLSPVHSPISCTAIYIKENLQQQGSLAVLSPCIAKKSEFIDTGLVKYNVTFKKLKEYIEKNKIEINNNNPNNNFSFPFDGGGQGLMGSIYPRIGGLRDTIWLYNPDINITTSEGVHKVYPELDMYAKMPDWKHPEVYDVLSCEQGCNGGIASNYEENIFDIMAIMRDTEKHARKLRKTSLFGNADKLFKKFDEILDVDRFLRNYNKEKSSGKNTVIIKDFEIDRAFDKMGKKTREQQHYDCHACGYKSCREMATAIARGINTEKNCIVFAKNALKIKNDILANERKEIEKIGLSVNNFSQKLLADIENIYSMIDINKATNEESIQKSESVVKILNKAHEICTHAEYLDADGLKRFGDVLISLKVALSGLEGSIDENQATTNSVHGGMKSVAQATEELNVMVTSLVNSFGTKY